LGRRKVESSNVGRKVRIDDGSRKYGWLSVIKFNYCKPSPLLG